MSRLNVVECCALSVLRGSKKGVGMLGDRWIEVMFSLSLARSARGLGVTNSEMLAIHVTWKQSNI